MVFSLIREVTPGQLADSKIGEFLTGPLSDLDISSSGFNYDVYSYPLIQNPDYPDKGHNIVFHINIPNHGYWESKLETGEIEPVANRNSDAKFGLRPDNPPRAGSVLPELDDTLSFINRYVLKRHSKRTTATISLYVPDTMIFPQQMQYENVSLSAALGVVGQTLSLAGAFGEGSTEVAGASLASILPKIAALAKKNIPIEGIRKVGLSALGLADNPQNFLLFRQIDFRKFQMEFTLTPENAKEASIIKHIIYLFRFHSAPEVAAGSLGAYFIPPSDFDIDILFNGKRNPFIPRISTCVLTNVTTDYGASGHWSTMTDGMPQQIKLTLDFVETEILTKDRIAQGF